MPIAIFTVGLFQSYSGIYWRTFLHKSLPPHLMGRLTSVKYIISSIHIGVIALIVSFALERGFELAIAVSVLITIVQVGAIFIGARLKTLVANSEISSQN